MKRPVLMVVGIGLALFLAACGGGSSSSTAPSRSAKPSGPGGSKVVACKGSAGLRATSVDCASARKVMSGWRHDQACALGQGASRGACSVSGFRCQSVRTAGGAAVSCARPGEAVSFIPRRGG